MNRFLLVVSTVLAGLALFSCATMNSLTSVPLPTVQIVSPDPNLSPEIKAFSGKWSGRWWNKSCSPNHGLDAILIVEEVSNDHATVVYCWGNSPEWGVEKGWNRFKADFKKNKSEVVLVWDSGNIKCEFRVRGDNLEGVFDNGNYTNFITMRRLQ